MWPWEHLAFGYLLYLLVGAWRPAPRLDDLTFIVLVVGTQLPDLIDKPLAWSLGVLPSGLSLGHSVGFLALLAPLALAMATRYDRPELARALVTGVASHLVGDVLFALLIGSATPYQFLLWPVIPTAVEPNVGLVTTIGELWLRYLTFLTTPRGATYLVIELLVGGLTLATWLANGAPGTIAVRRWAARGIGMLSGRGETR